MNHSSDAITNFPVALGEGTNFGDNSGVVAADSTVFGGEEINVFVIDGVECDGGDFDFNFCVGDAWDGDFFD